jgi:methyl-accepting chemotaxis protein
LSIKFKISALAGVLVLLLVVNSLVAYRMIKAINNANEDARNNKELTNFLVKREVDHLVWVNLLADVLRTGEHFEGQLDHTECGLGKWYYSFIDSDRFQKMPEEQKTILRELEEPHRALHQSAARINEELAGDGGLAGAQEIYADYAHRYLEEVRTALDKVSEALARENEILVATAEGSQAAANRTLFGVTLIALIVGLIVTFTLTRSITAPLANLVTVSGFAAAGDLTTEINVGSRDETGKLAEAFRTMIRQMRDVVKEIVDKSGLVAGSAEELSSSSQQTAAGANETSTTMNEISATVQQVTSSMQEISSASDAAVAHAGEGSKGISRITEQMSFIAKSSGEAARAIDGLSKKSQEINQIVDFITGIAEQTNLLALNAAIEAARAGEQGRGFAVVAEEVRKLAEQSAGAAREIGDLIGSIQKESQNAVTTMAEGVKNVEAGTRVVSEVGESFARIINAVQGLTAQIEEVASATEQMSAGVQSVAASTEEQTAAIEQVSASAETLSHLSDELKALVSKFKV